MWVLLAGRGQWLPSTALLARFDGDAWDIADFVPGALPELFTAGSSSVWAVGLRSPTLNRFDGSRWQQQDTPAGFPGHGGPVVGPDDTLWSLVEFEPVDEWSSIPRAMAHYDGAGWQRYDESRFPTEDETNLLWALQPMEAGPDGSVWGQVRWGSWVSPFSPQSSEPVCDGAARFDGMTVSRHLRGLCVDVLDVAADGSAWLLAGLPGGEQEVYVITPEAVAASGQ